MRKRLLFAGMMLCGSVLCRAQAAQDSSDPLNLRDIIGYRPPNVAASGTTSEERSNRLGAPSNAGSQSSKVSSTDPSGLQPPQRGAMSSPRAVANTLNKTVPTNRSSLCFQPGVGWISIPSALRSVPSTGSQFAVPAATQTSEMKPQAAFAATSSACPAGLAPQAKGSAALAQDKAALLKQSPSDLGAASERLKALSGNASSSASSDHSLGGSSPSMGENRKKPTVTASPQRSLASANGRATNGSSSESARSFDSLPSHKEALAYQKLVDDCKKMEERGSEGIASVKTEGRLSTGRMEHFAKTCSDIRNKSRRSVITSMRKRQTK